MSTAAPIRAAEFALGLAAAVGVAQGLVMGAFGFGLLSRDPIYDPMTGCLTGVVGTLLMGAVGALWAVVCVAAIVGLVLRKPWGRALGVVAGAFLALSGCLPLGVVVLYGLLSTGEAFAEPVAEE